MLWDIDNADEIDWWLAQAQADVSSNDSHSDLSTCVRCQAEINLDEVFCPECYDYLDEQGYFE